MNKANRTGVFIQQPGGYKTFKPCKLIPTPKINYDAEIMRLLSEAERKLGRLDGITQIVPNPELFVVMYIRKEAILSSQIEGTQASMSDILEADEKIKKNEDIEEVFNYIKALYYGLDRLERFPLSLRLLRDIHRHLLASGRGSNKNPGEFRTDPNWIGPEKCSIEEAVYVSPTVPDMKESLYDLEEFFYSDDELPTLIKIAIIHSQFESIHPFNDGNGRMGRLLITFLLCRKNILSKPLLYLSYYFKQNRLEYYDQLMNVRTKGEWEEWIKFFLNGVAEVADKATQTGRDIFALKNKYEKVLSDIGNANSQQLLEYIFEAPYISKGQVKKQLDISYPTASKLVEMFCEIGILKDDTPSQKRNKIYKFSEYMEILDQGTEL